jgi:hypothetical protein
MTKQEWRESDLAPPVCDFLVAQGYTVRSEVKDCDITAVQDGELIVVELKRGFTIDLLIQAVERQRVADTVYVAIPLGERRERFSRRWQGMERVLKRLELGLILVHFLPESRTATHVEVVFHPVVESKARRRPKQRQAILREIAGRSADYNTGGSTRLPLLTAYREQAIRIALFLDRCGPQSPHALQKRGCCSKTPSILRRNVYNWFERQGRGLYAVRPTVCTEIMANWGQFADRCCELMKPDTQEPGEKEIPEPF